MKQFNHSPHHWTRRRLLRLGVTGAILPIAVAQISSCTTHNLLSMRFSKQANSTTGRLRARPTQPTEPSSVGLHSLGLGDSRDGVIYVPAGYRSNHPIPLILMLHGAGGDGEGAMNLLQDLADPFETILLAVDSRRQTWDVIVSQYGSDIAFIDQTLTQTFNRYAIDPNRVAIAGFSDGASYALSVGLTNGDLFKHIIAFSPGFMAPADQVGAPRIFISHGQQDTVLPIDRCSRRIVPRLQQAGYEVLYQEFDGPHTVPGEIRRAALEWFMDETITTP